MKKLKDLKVGESVVTAMPWTRINFVNHIRDSFLGGAVGEYAKVKFAEMTGTNDFWTSEVKTISAQIRNYLDKKKEKTSQDFDRKKAIKQAIKEASSFQHQIVSAKNEFLKYPYIRNDEKLVRTVLSHKLESESLMNEMITKFLPEFK